jgi:hypothetical protein
MLVTRGDAMIRKLIALGCYLLGSGTGCSSSDSPLQPVHSPSFFPVRGTTAAGMPTDELEWIYRMNGGDPTPISPTGGVTVRYADHRVRLAGTTLTKALYGKVANTDGSGWAGDVSSASTDHLSSDSPATVLARDLELRSSLVAAGSPLTIFRVALTYDFGAIPAPTFYDRTDLDTLAVGYSESVSLSAVQKGTHTVMFESTNQTSPIDQSATVSLSWSVDAVLPTFEVLGKTYANVVRVNETMMSSSIAGDPTNRSSLIWLAKGVGMIRAQTRGVVASGVSESDTYELTRTNLVAP